jgi:hypothetical protein
MVLLCRKQELVLTLLNLRILCSKVPGESSGGAGGKEDGQAVDDGVEAAAGCAGDVQGLQLQGLMADGADEPAKILLG